MNALIVEALKRGYTAVQRPTHRLLADLQAARADGTYRRRFHRLANVDVLGLDDFGLRPLLPEPAEDLYDLIRSRYERKPVILTILWNQKSTSFPQQIRHELVDSSVDVDRSALSSWFKVARESLAQSRTSGRSADREPTSPLIPVCG